MKMLKILMLLALTNTAFAMTGDVPPSFYQNQAQLGQDHFGEDCAANGDSFSRGLEKYDDHAVIEETLKEVSSGI